MTMTTPEKSGAGGYKDVGPGGFDAINDPTAAKSGGLRVGASGTAAAGVAPTPTAEQNVAAASAAVQTAAGAIEGVLEQTRPLYAVGDDTEAAAARAAQAKAQLEAAYAEGPGAVDALKQDLYWAGYYGDKTVAFGDDQYTQADLDALSLAMNDAGLQPVAVPVTQWLNKRSRQGRKIGTPIGVAAAEGDMAPGEMVAGLAQQYGLSVSGRYLDKMASGLEKGALTEDQVAANFLDLAKSRYPAWSNQLDSGMTPEDFAAPYKQVMSSVLEVPEEAITLDDQTLQKALAGVGKDGKPSYMPLWQFQQSLRQDPRWQYTDNAYQEVFSAVDGIQSRMGF